MTRTPTRRGHNEGTIKKRSDGRWEAQVMLPDGRRKSFYGKTRQEVNSKRIAALRDLEQGLPIADERQTVETFLSAWLETMRPPRLVEETWKRYRECVTLHIVPAVGRLRLAHLSAQRVQQLYAECLAKGLSSTSVRQIHAVLHRALESAVRLGIVPRNVSDLVDAPKRRPVEIHPLTREQARAYLAAAAAADDRLEALFTLALATGMRQGELLGLRWRDVDLDRGTLQVVATLKRRQGSYVWAPPKSARSRRQIALAPHVADLLRRHRTRQLRERLAVGADAWAENDLVFADEAGGPLSHDAVRRRHWHWCRAADVPRIRFHDLRHTCATLLLGSRVNPKVVSEMLGHATVSITLDIYSHVLPDMQQDAAAAIAAALGWSDLERADAQAAT